MGAKSGLHKESRSINDSMGETKVEERDLERNPLNEPLLKRSRTLASNPVPLVGAKVSYIGSLNYDIKSILVNLVVENIAATFTGHSIPMATSNFSHQTSWLFPTACVSFQPPSTVVNNRQHLQTPKSGRLGLKAQFSLMEQGPPKSTTHRMQQLVGFLKDDLPHLFDDQDTIQTSIAVALDQTGPYEITTRWTVGMTYVLLPWKPELVLTGTSVMGVDPENGKFCSHVDYWDSIQKNEYFSFEGLWDIIKQLLMVYKTPELESPKYRILKRTAHYEVRRYDPFIVVETNGDKLSGSTGFNDVAGYIFGKNSTMEKIPMTTPVFTQAIDNELSKVSIQIVLPSSKGAESLPNPNEETVRLRKVEGGIAAAMKFSGKATEDTVREKEKTLRSNIIKDGLKPQLGCLLARYNDPDRTRSFIMVRYKTCLSFVMSIDFYYVHCLLYYN
ncbi:hypothetical protein VNO77_22556 [Canavalia gladiata]|uniref:Uncharacterized protein n=1 Tax=Canavalia gladiata TaxID=3824 RepID=A0AAN9L2T9_CANGL